MRAIQRVEPGHVVTITPAGESSRRYWSPERRELRLGKFDDYVEAFRAELDRAVASRLRRADGGIAAHLSGGWDSGAVAATAARLLAPGGEQVMAFTSIPPRHGPAEAPGNRFADESPLAAATAALHGNIDHILIESSGQSPIARLNAWARLYERPSFNICNHVWLAQIREAARARGARVLLTGEIGNWTISAAPNYVLADYLREGRWREWWREARAMRHRAGLRGIAANSFGPWLPDLVWNRLRHFSSGLELESRSALHPRLRDAVWREQEARRIGLAGWPSDVFQMTVDALYEMDFGEYRKGILGGWRIDKRDATADRRLVEFCLSLPIDMLLKNGVRRPLARAALADRLPPAVLDERRKGYQAADWHEALTRDLPTVSALIDAISADKVAASLIDTDYLRALVRDWPKGGWDSPLIITRYRIALLQALSAGAFTLAASP